MAIGADTNWYIRVAGNELNGGGYDSTISGAGSNYADQDSAQLSLTDIVTVGSTTVTSITGGFTSAMIGNCLRIAGDGYYFITARASNTSITVDRATGTGAAQNARVGGAHASIVNYSNGGTNATPLLTTPLVAGNTINLRGGGSDDPSSADYDWSGGYWTLPSAGGTKVIRLVGYNGRPHIACDGLLFYGNVGYQFKHLKVKPINATNGSTSNSGIFSASLLLDCIIDQNGFDIPGVLIQSLAVGNEFRNTGSSSQGSASTPALYSGSSGAEGYTTVHLGNYIHGWRGDGVIANNTQGSVCVILNNIVSNCKRTGIILGGSIYVMHVVGNTVDSCTNDGISFGSGDEFSETRALILNNILSNNGGYGLNMSGNRHNIGAVDYNNFFNNTSGARNNVDAGSNDLALDPQYANVAGGDFSIGINLKGEGFPGLFLGSATTASVDIGAVQRRESLAVIEVTNVMVREGRGAYGY